MNKAGKIISVEPQFAIPGGEITINCEGFRADHSQGFSVLIDGLECRVIAASSSRVIVNVPDAIASENTQIVLESGGEQSAPLALVVGREIARDMHIVANPAVDPKTNAIILTRSGGRGQQLPVTLFRLESDGYLDEIQDAVLNPTGIAFDKDGRMFVTNRAAGEVYEVGEDGTATVYATGLGIATGIAFDDKNRLYVGDRSGTIHRVTDFGNVETFTVTEPSVAAYHLAFGTDGRLFMTGPALASYDSVKAIDTEGFDEPFARGFGRPQGIAFDNSGYLYAAACYKGRHGIVRIAPDGLSSRHFVAGNNIVGLCFTRNGEMIVATGDTVYSIPCGIHGTLLN